MVFLLLGSLYAGEKMDENKPKIDFYKNGKLMWLIDTTKENHDYSLVSIKKYESYGSKYSSTLKRSYENYLNQVNTNKDYKYSLSYKGWLRKKIYLILYIVQVLQIGMT